MGTHSIVNDVVCEIFRVKALDNTRVSNGVTREDGANTPQMYHNNNECMVCVASMCVSNVALGVGEYNPHACTSKFFSKVSKDIRTIHYSHPVINTPYGALPTPNPVKSRSSTYEDLRFNVGQKSPRKAL